MDMLSIPEEQSSQDPKSSRRIGRISQRSEKIVTFREIPGKKKKIVYVEDVIVKDR